MVSQNEVSQANENELDAAIAEFLQAVGAGRQGTRQEWLKRFPRCATGLNEFFEDHDQIQGLLKPLQSDLVDAPAEVTGEYASSGTSADVDTCDHSSSAPEPISARYRPIRFHARGGMGEVWLAKDESLGRRVAIKRLRRDGEAQRERFAFEARITGQLEHPSIVPLHDLAMDYNGHPFYAMKFIEGRRLTDAITEFHFHRPSRDWHSDVEFLRLLNIFVDVCHAVAYAHSKGVLHRDIKPDNVMIGHYGETILLDWGLAKQTHHVEERAGQDLALDGPLATQDGAIVGTPAYMPPEGAAGISAAVDQSSDVYLLGATLYQILTASPPRSGSSRWELVEMARNSPPIRPRQIVPDIPRALEAICNKAMARQKPERYQSPNQLSEDIERFMAREPTTAYREPTNVRCARWIRKRRRILSRSAVLIALMLLLGLALNGYRRVNQLAQREQARELVSNFHRLADEAYFYFANSDGISESIPYYDERRAVTLGSEALAIADCWGMECLQLPLPDSREDVRRVRYNLLLLMAQASLLNGAHPASSDQALAYLEQARSIREPCRGYYRIYEQCVSTLRSQPLSPEMQSAKMTAAPTAQEAFLHAEQLRMLDAGATAALVFGQPTLPREHLLAALEEYRIALQLDPRHYWAQYQVGRCLMAIGRLPESIEALSACVALRPDVPWAYSTRGLAHALSGRLDYAMGDVSRALELDPQFQPALLNRGIVNTFANDYSSALRDFDTLLTISTEMRMPEAAFFRARIHLVLGRELDAIDDLNLAISLHPGFVAALWFRAQAHFRSGGVENGCADLSKLVELQASSVTDKKFALAKALYQLALTLGDKFQYQALVQARELLTGLDPNDATAAQYQLLGNVQEIMRDTEGAIESYSQGLRIAPKDGQLRRLRGWNYVSIGQLELARTDFEAALAIEANHPEARSGLGFVTALLGNAEDAQIEALLALSAAADNYLVLHNVACIFGCLSDQSDERRTTYEDLALLVLNRVLEVARQTPSGPDPLQLISHEPAFPASLRARPEFEQLLGVSPNSPYRPTQP